MTGPPLIHPLAKPPDRQRGKEGNAWWGASMIANAATGRLTSPWPNRMRAMIHSLAFEAGHKDGSDTERLLNEAATNDEALMQLISFLAGVCMDKTEPPQKP